MSPTAPVKAPFTWPKSSLSSRVSGMAPQLTATKGLSRRGLVEWMARGDQLLAGAALAGDQHGGRAVRDLADGVEDLDASAALADDVSKRCCGLQLLPELPVLGRAAAFARARSRR